MTRQIDRRTLIKGGALSLAGGAIAAPAAADVPAGRDPFDYEIVKPDAEWMEQLGPEVFNVMRNGATEDRHSSPLIDETRPGLYSCRACDLPLYTHVSKKQVDRGWVFFRASEPNSLLMSIDGPAQAMEDTEFADFQSIEVHCRRCGSHIGHILPVEGDALHCDNGSALRFTPAEA